MSNEFKYQDATKPLTIHVIQSDIDGAIPGDARNCVISRAVQREYNCFDVTLFRTVAYVRKRENSTPTRYQISQSAHDTLVAWDASGRARPITVTFQPPRYGISSAKRKTKQYKDAKRKSYEKTKRRKEQLRRAYTRIDPQTLMGVRNGTGSRPPGSGKLRAPQKG